ncbi:hypothetical protein OUZ56_025412 [Daphnia magna]|uniref:Uncharacterized protein n=1 Tax=Daphnia magna TaxID=35525 RepID=A0ABQ9ZKE5_9CRUS|nr:hypothetical protein OUZ56_025412 [Daphnia magna]
MQALRGMMSRREDCKTNLPIEIQQDIDTPVDVTGVGPREAEASQKEGSASAPKKNPLRQKKKESPRKTRDSGGENVANHELPSDGQLTRSARLVRKPSVFDLVARQGRCNQCFLRERYRQKPFFTNFIKLEQTSIVKSLLLGPVTLNFGQKSVLKKLCNHYT